MIEDKSPLQRLLDVVVFGPTGLAITMGEEFPKLVDKGRHRIEGQVHTARLVGQFAVQFGRQKVEEWSGSAASKASSVVAGAHSSASADPRADATPTEAAAGIGVPPGPAADGGGAVAAGTAERSSEAVDAALAPSGVGGNGTAPGTHLAIPGYDSLSASQVVQRLDGLSGAELEEVRAHELATRRRRTILNRVDQLLAGAPPGPA